MFSKLSSLIVAFAVIANLVYSSDWLCIDVTEQRSLTASSDVVWTTQNCTNDLSATPLLTVNAIIVDLSSSKVRVVPAVADPARKLQPVPDMATQNLNFIAGLNGGYFWRVDITGVWIDDVCWGKTRAEANGEVSADHVNNGISDGLVKVDGKLLANNCNCTGYSRPAVAILNDVNSRIDVLHRGETVGEEVTNAIAAGPNLVSFDPATGESYVDIPSDDDNINILEHAANSAVGIQTAVGADGVRRATKLLLVTTDGSDECGPKDISCGLNSKDLASLMKDHFATSMAMSMDQGGSTTMWVKGANPERNGVVSRSHNTEPAEEDGPRNVANGVFVEILP